MDLIDSGDELVNEPAEAKNRLDLIKRWFDLDCHKNGGPSLYQDLFRINTEDIVDGSDGILHKYSYLNGRKNRVFTFSSYFSPA